MAKETCWASYRLPAAGCLYPRGGGAAQPTAGPDCDCPQSSSNASPGPAACASVWATKEPILQKLAAYSHMRWAQRAVPALEWHDAGFTYAGPKRTATANAAM